MTPFLSIIVPMYNEELAIDEMYSRIAGVLHDVELSYEIVMVDDGSRDNTLSKAKEICSRDNRVRLIRFSRNFGHQIAITAGMDRARGQVIAIIDADLQDPPEVILKMIEKWKKGYQVVYGKRIKRKGENLLKRGTAAIFYRVLRKMTAIDIPLDTGDFRLVDKKVVEQLRQMRERNRFVRGMVSWVGFKHCEIEYVREKRFAGKTKYPFKKMLKFAVDGMLSFSEIPLKLSSIFGFVCSALSFFLAVIAIVVKLSFPEKVIPGWASIFVASVFLGGIQLICIGILGEYLGRIYDEIKGRPLYIIDEEINFQ